MNRATVYELECFTAVAEELNFSRAARRLHISQPPLSRQIQSLEAKLEARLLTRNTRTVSLTAAGRLYLDDARLILARLDEAGTAARRAKFGQGSRLRLAFVGALLDEKLMEVLNAFRQSHPECQIHLADLAPAEQMEALRAGEVDGAFMGAAPQKLDRRISTIIWKREPLLIALPEKHPCSTAKSVALSSLTEEDWVMVSRATAPAFRRQFDQLCASASIRPRVVQESERAAAVLTMVAAAQGVSLLPEAVSRLIRRGVVFRPMKGAKPMLDHTFAYRARAATSMVLDLVKLLARRA